MISVIIPTYNRENTIVKCLDSVCDQTYKNIEIIIVDDCSTDNTVRLVEKKALKDNRIRIIKLKKNSGACFARNLGVENSNGKYVAFQDSDDIWEKNKLEEQIKCLKKYDADIVFCKYFRIYNGRRVSIEPKAYSEGFLKYPYNVYGIGTQTLLGIKDAFLNNKFDIEMPRFQELELLLRICRKYKVYCLDVPLVCYEVSSNSISCNPSKLYNACTKLLEKHPDINKEYNETSKSIAILLIKESCCLNYDNLKLKNEMCKLSLSYDKGLKNTLKFYFSKMGMLRFYYLLKRRLRKR